MSRIRTLAIVVLLLALVSPIAAAQSDSPSDKGRWSVTVSAGGGFPSGRFGETDIEADPPKSGNDPGLSLGGALGYHVSDFLMLGGAISHSRFDLDFGSTEESLYPTSLARTSVTVGEATVHFILARALPWWKPYAVVGIGLGSPRATVEYKAPRAFPGPNPEDPPIEVAQFESKVNTAIALSGGIGTNLPLSRNVAINIEGRYRNISTEGTDRTDTYTLADGERIETEDKAKSDTQWWDLRGGLTITIP